MRFASSLPRSLSIGLLAVGAAMPLAACLSPGDTTVESQGGSGADPGAGAASAGGGGGVGEGATEPGPSADFQAEEDVAACDAYCRAAFPAGA